MDTPPLTETEAREAVRKALTDYKAVLQRDDAASADESIDREISIAQIEAAGRVLFFESPRV